MLTGRAACAADLPAIIDLLADDELGQTREDVRVPQNPRYLAAFEAIKRDPNQLMAVFEVGGDVVGCMQISFIPGLSYTGLWRGQIESVRISKCTRGTGLGKQMVEWGIERCRDFGCGLVQLSAHKSRDDALRFYGSLGFEATHDGLKLNLT